MKCFHRVVLYWGVIMVLLLSVQCDESPSETDAGVDGGDGDADTDSDSDTDTDTDADTDTGSGGVCGSIDPNGFGDCEMALGFVFDGENCRQASGCGCEPHCDSIFETIEECQAACFKTCGGFVGATCDPDEYCAYDVGDNCGAADAASLCLKRPEGCGAVYDPVCGCNGKTYGNKCEAAGAGFGIMSEGEC